MNGASTFEFNFSNAVGFNEEHQMFTLEGDLVSVPLKSRLEIQISRVVHLPITHAWLLPSAKPGILNFELELEDENGNPDHVIIADAPIVEGAYVAAVESSCGKTLTEVLLASQSAMNHTKISS